LVDKLGHNFDALATTGRFAADGVSSLFRADFYRVFRSAYMIRFKLENT
jgi:hypothetical protein